MRSRKAPPNKKIGGFFAPTHPNHRIGAASNSAPHLTPLGWVMLSVLNYEKNGTEGQGQYLVSRSLRDEHIIGGNAKFRRCNLGHLCMKALPHFHTSMRDKHRSICVDLHKCSRLIEKLGLYTTCLKSTQYPETVHGYYSSHPFNSMELFSGSLSPMIFHWLFCIQNQSFPFVVDTWS